MFLIILILLYCYHLMLELLRFRCRLRASYCPQYSANILIVNNFLKDF
nr:MAG TPA: hypothetical protein [Caudoviricetes sp.]